MQRLQSAIHAPPAAVRQAGWSKAGAGLVDPDGLL